MPDIDKNEWGTPCYLLDAAREVLGKICLDPFSSAWHNRRVRAYRYFDASQDGLKQKWGPTSAVWCNPPYSYGMIASCVERWITAVRDGEAMAALILTNVDTSTSWCQRLMEYPHVMLKRRVSFHHPELSDSPTGKTTNGNRQAQMISYAGPRYPEFRRAFCEMGVLR